MSISSMVTKLFRRGEDPDSDNGLSKDYGLRVVVNMITGGLISLVIISGWAWLVNRNGAFWAVLGLSSIVSFAALFTGGFLGFLFGIPRSLQRSAADIPVSSENGNNERPYSNNTNLEQISDWLTKIIVGVSLTQLPAIQQHFHQLVKSVSGGFTGLLPVQYAYPFASGLIIFYTICGFLAVYIWAKIYFMEQLTKLEDKLNRRNIREQIQEVSRRNKRLEIARLENMLTEFIRSKNRILSIENQPTFKIILDRAQPGPIRYIEDCQKERWGAKLSSGGYKAEAHFKKDTTDDDNYLVTILVQPVNEGVTLNGQVYFFLHDSFAGEYNEYVKVAVAVNNRATIEFPSFEAFTVGIVLNNGDVKLEMDMNLLPNAPDDYKYSSPLLSYEEVKKERDQLLEEERKDNPDTNSK